MKKVPSLTTYHVTVDRLGYAFRPHTFYIGTSRDYQVSSGNRWGIDFAGSAIGDADNDGDVDFHDFSRLARRWGTAGEATATTPGDDATVDFHTLMDFLDQWLFGVALDEPLPVED